MRRGAEGGGQGERSARRCLGGGGRGAGAGRQLEATGGAPELHGLDGEQVWPNMLVHQCCRRSSRDVSQRTEGPSPDPILSQKGATDTHQGEMDSRVKRGSQQQVSTLNLSEPKKQTPLQESRARRWLPQKEMSVGKPGNPYMHRNPLPVIPRLS